MTDTEKQAYVDKVLNESEHDDKGRAFVDTAFFDEYFDLLPVGTRDPATRRFKGRCNNKLHMIDSTDRAVQSAGGKAFQKKFREEQTFKKAIQAALETENPKTGKTLREEVVDALVAKALDGCVGAFEALRDTAGEKPTEQVSMDIMTDADRELMNNLMSRLNDGNR